MDRNISDQLNKAFEAYRNASIEKDLAKKELQHKTEQFQRHTQQLEKKIEEQEKLISHLKTQLGLLHKHTSGELKLCESAYRKQEAEISAPNDQHPDNQSTFHRTNHFLISDPTDRPGTLSHSIPAACGVKSEDVLGALQEIQGTFQIIQTLARRQKDHLKRIHSGKETTNEQFSMPIQCTDDTAEQAEVPFPPGLRPEVNKASAPLASRGAGPDGALLDSLRGLSVKFPPSPDAEYDFLNSTPDKRVELPVLRPDLEDHIHPMREESYSSYPTPSPSTHTSAASASLESVRGPQQLIWTPDLSDASGQASGTDAQQMNSRKKCAFCEDDVPPNDMYSHLNSHFKNKADK